MSDSQLPHLITMTNQIADNLVSPEHGSQQQTVDQVANHLKRFWPRPMKEQIIAYASEDGSELQPLALKAVLQLAEAYQQPSV